MSIVPLCRLYLGVLNLQQLEMETMDKILRHKGVPRLAIGKDIHLVDVFLQQLTNVTLDLDPGPGSSIANLD